MRKAIPIAILTLMIFLISMPDLSAQCSQCKLLAEQSGNGVDAELLGDDGGNNINTAILYIMAVPYIILTILFRKQINRFFKRAFSKQQA